MSSTGPRAAGSLHPHALRVGAVLACLVLGPLASAGPVAPSRSEALAMLAAADERQADVQAVTIAVGLLHARWAEAGPPRTRAWPCSDPARTGLATAAGSFLEAHRRVREAARLALVEAEQAFAAPTVAPLVLPLDRRALLAARERFEAAEATGRTLEAWHRRYIEPTAAACPAPLRADEGRPDPLERHDQVAVIGAGGGLLCPGGVPADGSVVLAPGRACVAATCDCQPQPVLPGAILVPLPSSAEPRP